MFVCSVSQIQQRMSKPEWFSIKSHSLSSVFFTSIFLHIERMKLTDLMELFMLIHIYIHYENPKLCTKSSTAINVNITSQMCCGLIFFFWVEYVLIFIKFAASILSDKITNQNCSYILPILIACQSILHWIEFLVVRNESKIILRIKKLYSIEIAKINKQIV